MEEIKKTSYVTLNQILRNAIHPTSKGMTGGSNENTEFTLWRDCTVINEFNQLRVIDRFVYNFLWPIPEDAISMIWMGKPIKKQMTKTKKLVHSR